MRIVVATACLPWPLDAGGKVSQFRTLESLQNDCDFRIIVPVNGDDQLNAAIEFQHRLPNITVIPIRVDDSSRNLSRLKGLPKKSLKSIVSTIQRLRAMFTVRSRRRLHSMPVAIEESPYYPFACLNRGFVDRVGREIDNGCDLFQAELLEMSTLGPMIATSVPKLFIHHQLHFVYANRVQLLSKSPTPFLKYLVKRLEIEERIFLESFDHAITFSDNDAVALKQFVPSLEVSVSPFPCPEDPISPADLSPTTDCHFVLVASEYGPNLIGFRWFMRDVWPRILAAEPASKVSVIGQWSKDAKVSVFNNEEVKFEGFVEHLVPKLAGKIMIVPLQVGSGIRTKILAAWAAGSPVVSTSIGAEGLPGRSGEDFMLADGSSDFANACLEVSRNIQLRRRLINRGIENIYSHFTLSAVRERRLNIYRNILNWSGQS